MRKFGIFVAASIVVLAACSKTDPVLPGTRESVFPVADLSVLNQNIPNLPENMSEIKNIDCPYTQDSSNIIWQGNRKIFTGFPTSNSVKSNQEPICDAGFIYAGLTTGELVKINRKSREIEWIADIYRASNMTGGATVLDIVAPLVLDNAYIYAGGIGDAFCKVRKSSGSKAWCLDIGVGVPFIVMDNVAFVVATNNTLYAINTRDGKIYWSQSVKKQTAPKYENKNITVGREKFDASNLGQPIK